MGYLSATLTQMFTRVRRADVSLRDVTIARDGKRGYGVRVTSRTGSVRRILGIWRKLVELRLDTERGGWLSLAREALWRVPHEMGGRWIKRNRKIVPLSPYVEEPLNSKVIKSFVPEQRCRKCFSCFEILMFYVIYIYIYIYIYIWTLYVHFTHGRIWLWYSLTQQYGCGRPEYLRETWTAEETCCQSNFISNSFQENQTRKILSKFEIQMDHQPQKDLSGSYVKITEGEKLFKYLVHAGKLKSWGRLSWRWYQ